MREIGSYRKPKSNSYIPDLFTIDFLELSSMKNINF